MEFVGVAMRHHTIDDLRANFGGKPKPTVSPEYAAKMFHQVPESTTVDRTVFVLQQVAGKCVLEFGATGPLHDAIVKAAQWVSGVDHPNTPGVISLADRAYMGVLGEGVYGFDFDDVMSTGLPMTPQPPDVIVCGEVIEHLSNPGWFLTRLKRQYPGVPVVITVPNAFSQAGRKHIATGVENVNRDHVAWYSWKTLTVLLGRVGYEVKQFHWYGGPPYVAEGLIVVAE